MAKRIVNKSVIAACRVRRRGFVPLLPFPEEPKKRVIKKETKMPKFKVGDLVIGNTQATWHYGATRGGWIGEVSNIGRLVDVKMMSMKWIEFENQGLVDPKYFTAIDRERVLNARAKFKRGDIVRPNQESLIAYPQDTAYLNIDHVVDRLSPNDSPFMLRIRPLDRNLVPPGDSMNAYLINPFSIDLIESVSRPTPEVEFSIGEDVICVVSNNRIGTILDKETGSDGTLYTVFIHGLGDRRSCYSDELKKDPTLHGNLPDRSGHTHQWQFKWDGTYRFCECGAKEWSIRCWTNYQWEDKAPDRQLGHHQTLIAEKVRTIKRPGWITHPHRTRSLDIISDEILTERINVIGAGAIGSFTVLSLIKMGFRDVHVWDPQNVAIENVGTQLYGEGQIGKPKVEALAEIIKLTGPKNDGLRDYVLTLHPELFNPPDNWLGAENEDNTVPDQYQRFFGHVIVAVDSMSARKTIWEKVRDHVDVRWLIDGRMGAENALLYTIRTGDEDDELSYKKTLYPDENALQEPCTAQGTVYTANLLAGEICKALKDALMKKKYPRIMHWNIADNHQVIYHKKVDDAAQLMSNNVHGILKKLYQAEGVRLAQMIAPDVRNYAWNGGTITVPIGANALAAQNAQRNETTEWCE